MTFFTLTTVLIFLFEFFLSWMWFFGQSCVFRIQQLKQLLEDSTSDEDGSSSSSSECKEKHKKKKKKEKHKKKKKEKKKKKKRKHKSSKSNESSDSEWQGVDWLGRHSLLQNQTLWPKMRGLRSPRGTGGTPREEERWWHRCGFSATFQESCEPQERERVLPGASSGERLMPGWKALLIVLLPADHCGLWLLRNASGGVARPRDSPRKLLQVLRCFHPPRWALNALRFQAWLSSVVEDNKSSLFIF